MTFSLSITRRMARFLPRSPLRYHGLAIPKGRPKVLVAGAYVGKKDNTIAHLVEAIAASCHVEVTQRWMCMAGGPPPPPAVAAVTVRRLEDYIPKWTALGELIGEHPWDEFDYVVFCDDDIWVGEGFLDRLIGYQQQYDFAIAQPARTWRSYTDWPIVRRRLRLKARETNFVESGPVVSMDKRFLQLVMPFSEESPMGWGFDLVWPILAHQNGLKLGIIDAVPVCHSLRQRGQIYDDSAELTRMGVYLANHEHTRSQDILHSYS